MTFDILRCNVERLISQASFEDWHQMRMPQFGGRLGFAQEPPGQFAFAGAQGGYLESNFPGQSRIIGPIDGAKRSLAQHRTDLEAANGRRQSHL
jgi:hypothetical protein